MGWNTFGRSAVFAAVAGCGVMPWLLAVAPLLGVRRALAFYLVAATAAYVTAIAPALRRGLGAGVLVGILGAGVAVAAHSLAELTLGLAMLLALARTGVLYRARPGRALALEVALVTGGLLCARSLAGSSLLSVMLALWGFLLVQSVFFLVGGVRTREAGVARKDPFDAAYERATALLEGLAV
jgi:hypothetical protein